MPLNPLQALLMGMNPFAAAQEQNNPAGPSSGAGGAAMAANNPLASIAGPILGGTPNPDQIDPNTGWRVGDVRQAQSQTLLQLAPLLIASGMRQMPSQRAATLAAGAAVLGQMPHNILNAAQTRLLNQKEAQSQAAYASQQEAIKSALARPDLSPAIKELIKANPDVGLKISAEQSLPTELERNANAVGIPTKEFFNRQHPAEKEWIVISDQNGGFVKYNNRTGDVVPVDNLPRVDLLSGQVQGSNTSSSTPPAPTAAPLSHPDYGFGPTMAPLTAGAAALMGSDPGTHARDVLSTRTALAAHNNRLVGDMSGELSGAGRSKWQAEKAQALLPSIGSWTTSPQEAADKYEKLGNVLDMRLQEAKQTALTGLTKKDREDAAVSYRRLMDTKTQNDQIIAGLRANVAGKAYAPQLDQARSLAGPGQSSGPSNSSSVIEKARAILGQ